MKLSRIWLPFHHISCTTLQLHITHGLHFPSTIAPNHTAVTNHSFALIVSPHLHLIHTHTISSTLPCTHCEVLFSPVWHFQAVSLCLPGLPIRLWPFAVCLLTLPAVWYPLCLPPARPLHCPCCWFCLAFVTPVTVSEPYLFDLLLFINKAAFGSNDTASSLQKYYNKL